MTLKDALIAGKLAGGGGVTPTGTLSITANGQYDVTQYAEADVNVPTGGGGVEENDVNFIDYDGTIVESYSAADFLAMDAMPENPEHTGLVAQGWNWSLADAQSYVQNYGMLEIGQLYVTDDGKTRLYITVGEPRDITIRFASTVAGGVSIDWGDGSAVEYTTGTAESNHTHSYSTSGEYVIALEVLSGELSLGGTYQLGVMGNNATGNKPNLMVLRRVEIGNNCNGFGQYAFWWCAGLQYITMTKDAYAIGNYTFGFCYSLKCIVIPSPTAPFAYVGNCFNSCYSMKAISLPKNITSLGESCLMNLYELRHLSIPDTVTTLGNMCLYSCYALKRAVIPDSVTNLNASILSSARSLEEVYISKNITSTNSATFGSCYQLKEIELPPNLITVGANMATSDYMLETIDIPDSVKYISSSAFQNCYNLRSVKMPASLVEIGSSAFADCWALTSMVIPSNVTLIGATAFMNCSGIKEYHALATTPPSLSNSNAFSNMATDCVIYVPQGSLSAYQSATNWSAYASKMVEE